MTPDEIRNLKAGPELDAMIAKLMGRPFRKPTHGACCTCQVCGWDYSECQCGWSANLAVAMEIFVWLAERGIVRLSNGDGDSCDVDFISYSDNPLFQERLRSAHVTAESYPLALCQALLLATAGVNQ